MADAPFAQIPAALLTDERVHVHDVAVYAALFSLVEFKSRRGRASLAQIVPRAHISRDSVVTAIQHLIDLGWISRTSRNGCKPEYELHLTGTPGVTVTRLRERRVSIKPVRQADGTGLPRRRVKAKPLRLAYPIAEKEFRESSEHVPAVAGVNGSNGHHKSSRIVLTAAEKEAAGEVLRIAADLSGEPLRGKARDVEWQAIIRPESGLVAKARHHHPDDSAQTMLRIWGRYLELRQGGNDFWRSKPAMPSMLMAVKIWKLFMAEVQRNSRSQVTREEMQETMEMWRK